MLHAKDVLLALTQGSCILMHLLRIAADPYTLLLNSTWIIAGGWEKNWFHTSQWCHIIRLAGSTLNILTLLHFIYVQAEKYVGNCSVSTLLISRWSVSFSVFQMLYIHRFLRWAVGDRPTAVLLDVATRICSVQLVAFSFNCRQCFTLHL